MRRLPRIGRVDIDSFRCFSNLRVEGLSHVNLFVGANNSGKTTLLEAIEAVASETSPFALYRASLERGECRTTRSPSLDQELDVRHWFYGHQIAPGARFAIRAAGRRTTSISRAVEAVPADAPSPPFVPGGFLLTLERTPPTARVSPLPLTLDGYLGAGDPSRVAQFGVRLRPAVGFVTTRRFLSTELAMLWAGVVLTPREDLTVTALRLIDPNVERIAISGGDDAAAQILMRGETRPVPLGTLGEGVSRMLALALHLAATAGGFLLVDEIETGLHWSVMPKLWRFLVGAARELDVQVFATTHSKDCLEGLASLHREDAELAQDVRVHRLEAGRDTTVCFDAGRIAEFLEMDLETR